MSDAFTEGGTTMLRKSILAIVVFATTAFVGAELADARRLGGGRSFGTQRQAAPPAAAPSATPSAPAAPMQSAAAAKAAPGAAAATSGASRWLGPIAGLAAGLGLAALMSHLGLSEAFGSFLLIALLVLAGVFVVRMLMGRRTPTARPMQYAGAGSGLGSTPGGYETQAPPATAADKGFQPVFGGSTAPVAAATASSLPAGFDPAPFIQQGKVQFRKLQAAYDQADRQALSEVMTPEMFAEVTQEIADRGTHVPTEVMQLDAEVLAASTEGDRHWMSIRFHGLLREDGTVLPKAFDEVWNLTKPVKGSSGWLLAGIQQQGDA
jgi:predicted lipid-binding transport protein (Tim44 family)